MSAVTWDVLYEDNHCLAVNKPAGMLTMGDATGDESLWQQARDYLKSKYRKPGNVYLGVVHRLDRPVSGVVLFARTSKAAARLSEQFRMRSVVKVYRGLVDRPLVPAAGVLDDWLLKDRSTNRVQTVAPGTPSARHCELRYRTLRLPRGQLPGGLAFLEIEPVTGRSHQIRVQIATRGSPICGDRKYGSRVKLAGQIALHAYRLTFQHPTQGTTVSLNAAEPDGWWRISR